MKKVPYMWPVLGMVLAVLVVIGLLVVFAPWVAAIGFALLATWRALHVGRRQGTRAGIGQFLKDMLFGW